jgi:hypothetical protein
VRERERKEEAGRAGKVGRGRAAGAHGKEGKRRERKAAGWAVQREREREREREEVNRANWAVREGEERPVWAGLQGAKKIGKRKRESGAGPIRKRERKRIVSKCI